ncbi:MAG: hypothetical protein M0T84_07315 [Betaproteobacteria bacterium]|nr:hypothetical protein [Betaproteobacteria bacterium]
MSSRLPVHHSRGQGSDVAIHTRPIVSFSDGGIEFGVCLSERAGIGVLVNSWYRNGNFQRRTEFLLKVAGNGKIMLGQQIAMVSAEDIEALVQMTESNAL